MKIKFNKILDLGSLENERVLLEVLEDCNLGSYLLALSDKIDENTISSKIENVFWLKDMVLHKGDLVVIYTTRQGTGIHTLKNPSGLNSHFLFWNLDKKLSDMANKKIVCLETTWTTMDISTDAYTEKPSEGN